MESKSKRLAVVAVSAAALVGLSLVARGVQAPSPAPGGATRIQSLPFTITAPGSYVVTRCLTGVAGQDGITVATGDVTIDLRGFTLSGVPGSLSGIAGAAGWTNVLVRNGNVRDWGDDGVRLFGTNSRVSDVRACGNGGFGVHTDDESLVDGVLARNNGAGGICVDRCAVVTDCVAALNGGAGITVGWTPNINSGSTVQQSSACFNSGYGIVAAPASVVADCAVVQNSGGGVSASFSLVRGNSVGGSIDTVSSTVLENHQY